MKLVGTGLRFETENWRILCRLGVVEAPTAESMLALATDMPKRGNNVLLRNPLLHAGVGVGILARNKLALLLLKPAFLTGAELKFLRKYLDLTQEEFAKLIGAKGHSNIAGWENKGQKPTGMVEQAEMIARLKLAVEFSDGAIKFEAFYARIVKLGLAKDNKTIELNMQNVA